MSILRQIPDKMPMILSTVPDQAAINTGLVERKRKLTGSVIAQTLVLGWLENLEASYHQLAQTAETLGGTVTRQAIEQRLTPQSKLHLRFDVLSGRFDHFKLTDGIVADRTAEQQFQPLPTGSLRLADLGYFSLHQLRRFTEDRIYWISRSKAGCALFDEAGEPMCLEKLLNAHPQDTWLCNASVWEKLHNSTHTSSQNASLKRTQTSVGAISNTVPNESPKNRPKYGFVLRGGIFILQTSNHPALRRNRYA